MNEDWNRAARETWDRKAEFWDSRMGDGNRFQRELIGPASEELLGVRPGELILEIACGNGVFSRRMADLGARVVATDFSARFLELARARETDGSRQIDYQLLDATDEQALAALGDARFDAAVCNMGLMDMARINPLMHALKRALKPDGRFVFSVLHPAFNIGGSSVLGLEQDDRAGLVETIPYVKLHQYLHVPPLVGAGMPDEPEPHPYFHRPLSALLGAGFSAGFVLDALREPAPAPTDGPQPPFGWLHFHDIPPVLVARMRPK
ncbi:MAG TPA: class I SAM-dependent methyltransferase [Chloroflexota bacterium]|jgi:2-polyprenyl-3-methyl-5-hydroxy-6-metoxy-1,4-benzoquinol methylase